MGFELVVVGGLLALFLTFYAIGKYSSASPAEFLDWKPTRSYETEIELELQDVQQMIDAQNERRRRDGRPLIDADAYRNMVEMEGRQDVARAERIRREQEELRERLGDKEYRRRVEAEERKRAGWRDKERRGF
jgi:protein-S-isoprenylcysteine O-methyltransferase Ste14